MSLEERMAELTAALNANTAALTGGAGVAPAKAGRPAKAAVPAAVPVAAAAVALITAPVTAPAVARQPTADTAASVTPAQIKAAGDDLTILANELGARDKAIAILGEFGVQKMTAMPAANIPEFHNRVKAAIAALQPVQAASPSLV